MSSSSIPLADTVRLRDGSINCEAEEERFIRTLKENLLWIRTFDTVEDLRLALLAFRDTYNTTWLVQRLGYRAPAQVRQDQLSAVTVAA